MGGSSLRARSASFLQLSRNDDIGDDSSLPVVNVKYDFPLSSLGVGGPMQTMQEDLEAFRARAQHLIKSVDAEVETMLAFESALDKDVDKLEQLHQMHMGGSSLRARPASFLQLSRNDDLGDDSSLPVVSVKYDFPPLSVGVGGPMQTMQEDLEAFRARAQHLITSVDAEMETMLAFESALDQDVDKLERLHQMHMGGSSLRARP